MAKLKQKAGITSKLVRLFIQDSSSTTGAGLTGLTNASSGLTAYYLKEGDASATAITLASGTVGTWSSGGFKEVDATNLPGVYELGLPNAAVASGKSVLVMLKGATNMAPVLMEIELDAVDYQDATAFGLSRLDAAVSSRLASGAVTVGTNNDKTGYALTVAPPTAAGIAAVILATPSQLLATDGSGRVTVGANADKTGYALTAGEHTAISGTDVTAGLTAQGYTTTRAGYLDTLNGLVAAIWSAAARTLTSATGIAADIAADVWNAVAANYNSAGSMGNKVNAAASAGDPWSTTVPGSYANGTAGAILGSRLDVAVTTRQASGSVTVGGYAAGEDPASLVLATPSHKIASDTSGRVQLDTTQAVPTSNTAQTVGDALNAARAQGFGKWVKNGLNLTLYAPDGTTIVHIFTLDDATTPSSRT